MGERPKKISDKDLLEHFGVELGAGGQEDQDKDEAKKINVRGVSLAKETTPPEPPVDLRKVIFTTHAIDQFTDRFKKTQLGRELIDPKKTALKILAATRETDAIGKVHKIRRLIKHSFDEVRYFTGQGWRFVVKESDGKFLVVTIERTKKS